MPENDPTKAELRHHVEDLEHQVDLDHQIIADLEADGLIDRTKIANLEMALATCRRIGSAIGVLMALHQLTERQAFGELTAASNQQHRKLRDVADDVVQTGTTAPPA